MSADEIKASRVMKIGEAVTFERTAPPGYAEIDCRFGAVQTTSEEEANAYAALQAQNYQEAARLFEPHAERGSAWAHINLGWMHLNGHLGPADIAKAIAAFESAAIPGYPEGKYFLGLALLKKGDRDGAEKLFREGAAEDHARCIAEVMHLEETRAWEALEACNHDEAARLLEPLVARGSTYAMVQLGRMYERGRLGAPDLNKAMSLWEEAERLGSIYAKYTMARSLRRTGDKARARALFLEGAEQGDKPCTYWAGRMLVRGEGGEPDHAAGVALLTRAADSGHVFARRDLLRMDLNEARTVLGKFKARGRIVGHLFASIRRAIREPDFLNSDDLY